jgi:hypothetical protein
MRREADPVKGADEIGREHEAALEHRHNQQVLGAGSAHLAGKLLIAAGNSSFVEQDPHTRRGGHRDSVKAASGRPMQRHAPW